MKENNLSPEIIINHISDSFASPLFIYEISIDFDDLYARNVKKHPFNLKRMITTLIIFFILTIIYFSIVIILKKNINFSLFHFIIIFLLFVLSKFIEVMDTKKSIIKIASMSGSKLYFYDKFLIIKTKDSIEKILIIKLYT